MGHPARLRLVRGAARRPGDRGRLHLAPEHDARRVVDQVRRGRQARALREAVHAPSGGGHRGVRRGRPGGKLLTEAFMYRHNPQTKKLRALIDEGAIGEVRLIRSVVQLLALRRRQHPPAHRRRGRRADGRRLLLRQRLAARGRRRARVGLRAGVVRAERDRLGLHRARCASPATCSPIFDCGTAMPDRDELEVIGSEGSLFLDDPWHAPRAGDRAPARRRRRADRGSSAPTRTGSSSRT